MDEFMDIFTLVTGIIYLVLEIRQKNFMWVVGIITGAAASAVFLFRGLYASMALNIYYVLVSFWGLYCWRRDSGMAEAGAADAASSGNDKIHINRLPLKTVLISLGIFLACVFPAIFFLKSIDDPMPVLDASVTVASAIATYWLSRSYLEQWLLWIAVDFGTAVLCFCASQNWMALLYLVYSLSAIYGYSHWKRGGVVV
ncbi:MAG: nicotinamide riboside transporter PnuC [Bacteroidales bacterium]|jgi:nicotinamide mononucleotide transporter|nr:nicotinamide riboside transporter PnuC [Bacteroidales bacterium]MCI1785084.1 nicotinamide riboside transporter PnuC [Bacteroidales bacterium]